MKARTVQEHLIYAWAVAFVRQQSEGEWDDATIERDAEQMTTEIVERLPLWETAKKASE